MLFRSMANPNMVNVSTITGNTVTAALTTTTTTALLSGSANSVSKVISIVVANINGSASASTTMSYYDGTNDRYFAYQITVPAGSSVVLIDKNSGFYITESAQIRGGASLNSYLTALISYETIS